MTDIVPVPEGVHSTEFPTNADRTAGTFNPKVVAWGDSTRAQSVRDREIAEAGHTNAVAANERAVAAESSKNAAASSASTANTQANRSRDEADRSEAAKQAALVAAAAAGAAAGLPSMVGKAGQALVVLPDETGAGWAVVNARGSQEYTASQSINKSIFGTATYVLVELWGGGGSGGCSGGSSAGDMTGGEGGSYASQVIPVASLAPSTTLTVGAGGAAVVHTAAGTSNIAVGLPGGNSSFQGLTALGGIGSSLGGGAISPMNAVRGANGGSGGGTGSATVENARNFSGGGGSSVFGGGGGGAGSGTAGWRTAGASFSAGAGGAGASGTATGVAGSPGQFPSGGGGGARLQASSGTCTSGTGSPGKARLTWW